MTRNGWYIGGAALAVMLCGPQAGAEHTGSRTPQEVVVSIFEQGGAPSPQTLIECIDDAYHALTEGEAFRTSVRFRMINRVAGLPDTTTTGSAIAIQQGTDVRFRGNRDVVSRRPGRGDIPPFLARPEKRFVFVRRGDELRSLETGVPAGDGRFVTRAFKIDLSGFSPGVQERVTGPFATLIEFDLLNAGSALAVERELYQGDPVLVLRTQGDASISDADQVEFATFFVEPDTCLVRRMEQHAEEAATEQFIEFEGDITYTRGVFVPPGAFLLRLPPDAVDLTNDPEFLAGIEAQMQFDDEVLGPVD